jgi:hypothetical protein
MTPKEQANLGRPRKLSGLLLCVAIGTRHFSGLVSGLADWAVVPKLKRKADCNTGKSKSIITSIQSSELPLRMGLRCRSPMRESRWCKNQRD